MGLVDITFRPHEHQWDAIQATRDYPVVWDCGGLGAGKTHVVVHWLHLMLSDWGAGSDGLLVEPDYATFEDVFLSVWRQQIPGEGSYWTLRNTRFGGRHLRVNNCHGGVSTLFVRSAMNMQNVQRIDGLTTISYAAMDEPARMLCGQIAFEKILGRLRNPMEHWSHCPMLIVGSPRGLQHWTAEAFGCTEDHPEHAYTVGYEPDPVDHPGYYIRACKTQDNAVNLAESYEENAKVAYSDALYEQEFMASLISTRGMILPEFSKALHVIPDRLADELWQRAVIRPIGGMDWGFTAPAATEISGWTGDHMLITIDEWYKRGKQVQEQGAWAWHAVQQWGKRKGMGVGLTMPFYGDPADPGKIELLRKGFEWRGKRYSLDMHAAKYHGDSQGHTTAPTGWQARIDLLRSLLCPRPGVPHPNAKNDPKLEGVGCPRWLIAARCKNLPAEIAGYRQKEQEQGKPDREGATGPDHGIDACAGAAYTTDTTLDPRSHGKRAAKWQ